MQVRVGRWGWRQLADGVACCRGLACTCLFACLLHQALFCGGGGHGPAVLLGACSVFCAHVKQARMCSGARAVP